MAWPPAGQRGRHSEGAPGRINWKCEGPRPWKPGGGQAGGNTPRSGVTRHQEPGAVHERMQRPAYRRQTDRPACAGSQVRVQCGAGLYLLTQREHSPGLDDGHLLFVSQILKHKTGKGVGMGSRRPSG